MEMKSNLMAMAVMGAMLSEQSNYTQRKTQEEILKTEPPKEIIPKGLKEFFYGQEVIYALNQKNADKKARKQGLII